MNRKRLIGVIIAALLIVSSTAVIASARQISANYTKNNLKVVSDKENLDTKISNSKPSTIVISEGEHLDELTEQLKKMEDGTIKSTPESIQILKNLIEDIKNGKVKSIRVRKADSTPNETAKDTENVSNAKLLNISDQQAINTAKDAIKYYTGLDVNKVIREHGLKPYVNRSNTSYAWGPDILVTFNSSSNTKDNIFASISAVDGKVYNVTAMVETYHKVNIDTDKVKKAAASFLKSKGFGDNFKSITIDNEKTSAGIIGAKALYDDGTQILIEFKASDNSVINFTHYNLKTMKFAN